MKIRKHKILFAVAFCLTVFATGCSKDNSLPAKEDTITAEKELEIEKLRKFLAYTTSMPKDSILFNKDTQIFYMHNSTLHETYERVKQVYDISNVYKEEVENKN